MNLPQTVHITEVGPRDGLQMEKRVLPTDTKLALINGLVDAGLSHIQVAAFVHPVRMPQMADAEALIERLPLRDPVRYSALALNLKGVERACRTPIECIEISISASEAHGLRNAGLSLTRALAQADAMLAAAARAGRKRRASIQCTFGYLEPADVAVAKVTHIAERFVDQGIDLLVLADTAGWATPRSLTRVLEAVFSKVPGVPIGLHLHDTRGLGAENIRTALGMGIAHFDTALGGLGGCPFVPGARGNVATEMTVEMLHDLGIRTGIDAGRVAVWSRRLHRFFGHRRPAPA